MKMKTFLQEVAEKIYRDHAKLEEVTVVFPNRRAALYFRRHLSKLLTKPAFAPNLVTIEDFFAQFSPWQVPEKLVLIARLFSAYRRVMEATPEDGEDEEIGRFENFYFWGEMLLRDFDEIDKYMMQADLLFRDLSHQKELDTSFDFLSEEQIDFLRSFWANFDVNQSVNKRRFLRMWRRMYRLYEEFKSDLRGAGLAYEGMLHRAVVESLIDGATTASAGTVVFAGFNALTTAEERMITIFVERFAARVYWDVDAWYVNNKTQEAGSFFREYQEKAVLGKTFDSNLPAHFQEKISAATEVHLYGASQPVGQAKAMAQVLRDEFAKGLDPEETLIVLADEKLLIPVLHGVSGFVDKLNVTMGFPLANTPVANFVEHLIDLQIHRTESDFHHRQVLALLGHPYTVAADAAVAHTKRKEILKNNWVHIPDTFLGAGVPLHRLVFRKVSEETGSPGIDLIRYLTEAINEVGSLNFVGDVDREYAFQFVKFFNLLESVLREGLVGPAENEVKNLKAFLRLFRQLVRTQRIPFSGEPLSGLQVMGVLETRNLDFKNVFILSLNEGAFPATGGKGSYIPHNIRRAYGLPTVAHQDAIYSYLFYRVLQRAENIFLFYNSETDVLGQGEMSRYLQQLLFESGLTIRRHIIHNPIRPREVTPITVHKSEQVMADLVSLMDGGSRFKGISPSALNTYIECRLQFYFRHVAKIREADAVEEELDARVLGNFLHDVMEKFYKQLAHKKGDNTVAKGDFANASKIVDGLIDDVFRATYRLDPNKPVAYAGQRLIVREIVKRFAERIIRLDEAYAPFSIQALEQADLTYGVRITRSPYTVTLGGKIDRVDLKDDLLRIIDYKTGKDELSFDSLESLFSRDGGRNKAAFQTLLYAFMYGNTMVVPADAAAPLRIVPGLINRMNAFDDDFEFGLLIGKHRVRDVSTMFPEFEARLKELLEELFDPEQPFDQTPTTNVCKFCPYRDICYR